MQTTDQSPAPETTRLLAWLDLAQDEMQTWLDTHGEPRMRARQVQRWLIAGRAESFEQMSDLPKPLRAELAEQFAIFAATVASHQQAKDGTQKLLLKLADGEHIECVLLQEDNRRTTCISTQVGCGDRKSVV